MIKNAKVYKVSLKSKLKNLVKKITVQINRSSNEI